MLRINKTGYEEADLIADAVRRIDIWCPEGATNWCAIHEVFGIPEQAARELCEMHGVDPDAYEGM